jgi:hypothetical protein
MELGLGNIGHGRILIFGMANEWKQKTGNKKPASDAGLKD